MMMRFRSVAVASMIGVCVALTACGGGGGGSSSGGSGGGTNSSQATVDDNNARTLSEASAEGAKKAVAQSNAPRQVEQQTPEQRAQQLVQDLLNASGNGAKQTGARTTISGDCGGSATVTGGSSGSTITYNNFCSGGVVANGTAVVSFSSSGAYTITYSNFTVTYGGETYTLNMIVSCDSQGNCTYSEDFTGSDGRSYRVEGSTVSGNSSSGYNISATVYDPDYGYIEITATNVTFCSNGNPGTGSITFTGSGGTSASVTFDSCSSYTVTVDGVATSYNW